MAGTVSTPRALISLLVNLAIPGLGSLLGGRMRAGLGQLALIIVAGAVALSISEDWSNVLVGVLGVTAWLWAIVTSIELLQKR